MLYFVLGATGRFSRWCETLVAELAGGHDGPAPIISANTLAELALGALRTRASQSVVASRQPTGALRRALIAAGRRSIVTLDDPRTALLELVLRQAAGIADAVQRVASACSAFGESFDMPGALLLNSAHDAAGQETAATLIARHFGLPPDPAICARLRAAGHTEHTAVSAEEATAWWAGLDRHDQATIIGALNPYFDARNGGDNGPITWTHELFFHGERRDERLTAPVEISGRPRCLIQGPFIHLSPGRWTLSLSLVFSHAAAEREFAVEVEAGQTLASGTVHPDPFGDAAIELDFTVADDTHDPVAIRIHSLRAVFDGMLTIVGATLARIPADA